MKWRETPVQTLLVDLDGTLLDSRDAFVRIEFIARVLWRLRKHGGFKAAARSLRAVIDAIENPADGERHLLNFERGSQALARETGISIEEARTVLERDIGAIFPQLERYFYPVPGAREFIEWAKPRHRLILATNPVWPLEQVLLRLKWAGIDADVFSSITHARRMRACKPSADYYRELLEQEGLEASDCALVGDDVHKDLPATRVGISVFILGKQIGAPTAGSAFGSYADLTRLLSELGGA